MKKTVLFIIICLTLLCKGNAQDLKQHGKIVREGDELYLIDGRHKALVDKCTLTVVLNENEEIPDQIKVIRKNRLGFIDIEVPKDIDIEDYVKQLESTKHYQLVKYNLIGQLCSTTVNDHYAFQQWHLGSIGMYDAWDYTTGSPSVKVAVIDGNFAYNHPDLNYGYDTYRNIASDLGYNYTNMPNLTDHGTSTSGIIAAKTNNSVCVAGIAGGYNNEGVKILPFNIASTNNLPFSIQTSCVDDAIIQAVDNGAKIINMSFSIDVTDSNTEQISDITSAINYAYNHGVTLIAAAGNNTPADDVAFPASNSKVIAVGALATSLLRKSNSNYGVQLDIMAPGEEIWTTGSNGSFAILENTSAAAPQVSGVAALLLSINPQLTPAQIKNMLIHTATKIAPYQYNYYGWNNEVGHGMVNAFKAVEAASNLGEAALGNRIILKASNQDEGYWTSNYTACNNSFTIENPNTSYTWVEAELYRMNNNWEPTTLIKYWPNISITNAAIPGDLPGWYLFRLRGYNENGFTDWLEQEVEMVDFSMLNFLLDYDAASETLTLTLVEPDSQGTLSAITASSQSISRGTYEVEIWNAQNPIAAKRYKSDLTTSQFSLAGLPSGVYIVRVIINGKTYSKKFVKK